MINIKKIRTMLLCRKIIIALWIIFMTFSTAANAGVDLTIDLDYVKSTISITDTTFDSDIDEHKCQIEEGCTQDGDRRILEFGIRTQNIGDDDLKIGKPKKDDRFVFNDCHQHFHFETFAQMELFDIDCNNLNTGNKIGFCLENTASISGSGPCDCTIKRTIFGIRICGYDCQHQGIGAGCYDEYFPGLPCQFLDITNVPDGRYYFKITLNYEQKITETDYENNTAYFLIEIQGNKVDVLYSAHSIPNDIVIQNLDILPPPFNKLPRFVLARNTIEIKGKTTINDNKDREIVAGNNIKIINNSGTVLISASQGGNTHLYLDPCLLATSNLKSLAKSNDGKNKARSNEGLFATLDNSKVVYETTHNGSSEQDDDMELIDNSAENIFKIFPNPTHMGQFNVTLPFGQNERVKIHIHDVNGRLVLERNVQGESEVTLDLSNEAQGVYSINMLTDRKIITGLIANF
ncbi:MAG: T9SS type A sorting domain-containing protein [Bacteroidetes bacterium]|nr:T9SS type A sorting domain-containing protein [Bacteroidota bacterium]